jgi:hypothetical protein
VTSPVNITFLLERHDLMNTLQRGNRSLFTEIFTLAGDR